MTYTQYIAMRTILDYEIERNPENELLPKVIHVLVDEIDSFTKDEYDRAKEVAKTVSLSATGGVGPATLILIFTGLASAAALPTIATASGVGLTSCVTASWFKKLLHNNSKGGKSD